jgi:hypothetical protein
MPRPRSGAPNYSVGTAKSKHRLSHRKIKGQVDLMIGLPFFLQIAVRVDRLFYPGLMF